MKKAFSLIVILFLCIGLDIENTYFDIYSFVDTKVEVIKQKEIEYLYSKNSFIGDRYSGTGNSNGGRYVSYLTPYTVSDVSPYSGQEYSQDINTGLYYYPNDEQSEFLMAAKAENILSAIRGQADVDSYRHKKLGFYYIFDGDSTIDAIRELEAEISTVSVAQRVPKSLISAVLFREMMFLGQEDLLDGIPLIGGKSMGICQIGVKNVRKNEDIVHGSNSLIADKTDKEIKEMLKDPKQAVYFCAVQLRARAIKITEDPDVDLSNLEEEEIKLVLEGYNQSKISFTIGPVKTMRKYAEETYKYYLDFQKYYDVIQ